MLFSSVSFLFVFLPVVLLLCRLAPNATWKNHVLLAASLFFYFCGEPVNVVLLLISSAVDYLLSLSIEKHRGTRWAKASLIASVVINLGLLDFFKYADFLVATVNGILGTAIPLPGIRLPIGISFFTFQTMSYTIDVYRGRAKAEKNLASFATFVCLFPQLIAGPIVRYTDVAAELRERRVTHEDLYLGIGRFLKGLAKKTLLANTMGELCALYRGSADPSVVFAWVYAVAYSLQIFFDFSGYSDMAIGLGRMFGFRFPENFDAPFRSRSITEFWRRWHMTLGSWFRDYLYIPLGGNRVSKARWMGNLGIVWAATGLWHGAAWNFVLWGLGFGVILCMEKLFLAKQLQKLWRPLQHVYVLLVVLFSFVLFNAADLSQAGRDFADMLGLGGLPLWSFSTGYALRSYGVLLAAGVFFVLPLGERLVTTLRQRSWGRSVLAVLEPMGVVLVLLVVTAFLVDGSYNPFLYFRF